MTATRLPARSTSWFQRAEWKISPLEGLDALDLRQLGLAEAARAGDDVDRLDLAGRGADPPELRGLVVHHGLDGGVEDEPVEYAGPAGRLLQVGLDVRLRRERARPVGVGREREGVELARHVARGTRVGVVAPGAADVGAPLDDEEVGLSGRLQLDGHAESGEPGAHQQVAHAARERGGGHDARVWKVLNIRQ